MIYLSGVTSDLQSGSGYPVFVSGTHRSAGAATKYIGTFLTIPLMAWVR